MPAATKVVLYYILRPHNEDWSFTDSGPDEKDHNMLCKFYTVSRELNKLKEGYQVRLVDT